MQPVPRDGLPREAEVAARASGENFPVALRLLPTTLRTDLLAVYGFARLTDELGDAYDGDRSRALDQLEDGLRRATTGAIAAESAVPAATGVEDHPVVVRVADTIRRRRLPEQPFLDLIEANRRDQIVTDVATFDELLEYCRLSANPVGRIVLGLFDAATPANVALADRVCTGLQLAEHWQDVAEDAAAGRIYLPRRDRERFGVTPDDLTRATAGAPLRALLRFEVARARTWLEAGVPLARRLRGSQRAAVIGFTAGGLAALDAVEAAGFDVLARSARPTRVRLGANALSLWRSLR
jgi:squalene synthase HpnC